MIDLRAVDAPPYTPSLRASADEPEALLPGVDWVGPEGIVYPDFSRVGVDNGTAFRTLTIGDFRDRRCWEEGRR